MLLTNGSPFLPLLGTVINSILEVFIICLAGYVAARKGIIDKTVQRALNKLNVFIFTPSLLFSKVAFSLNPTKLKELWIIPLSFVIVSAVSALVANLVGRVFRLKRSQRNFAMAASMFMNSNSLPIALMQSLVTTVSALRWDENDEQDAMLGRALTYLVLFSTLGMVLRWSYGVSLLASSDESDSQDSAHHDVERAPRPRPRSDVNIVVHGPETDYSALNRNQDENESNRARREPNRLSHCEATYDERSDSDGEESDSTFDTGRGENALSRPCTPPHTIHVPTSSLPMHPSLPSSPDSGSIPAKISIFAPLKRAWRAVNAFMTPPLWAALLSLIVACVQPLQHFLDEHFPPVKGALATAGGCSVPVTMVVLGAYFYNSSKDDVVTPKPQPYVASASPNAHASSTDAHGRGHGRGRGEAMDERTPLVHKVPGPRLHKERSSSTLTSVASTISIVSLFQGVFRSKRPAHGAVYLEADEEAVRGTRTPTPGGSPAELSEDESDDAHAPAPAHDRDDTLIEQERQSETPDESDDRRGEGRTVLVAVLSRMVLVPLVLVPLFALAVQWDAHELLDDPVFIVCMVLLIASPPAMTLAQITQAASSDAFERLVSRTISWSYCIVTPPSTVIVVIVGLLIAGLA